MDHKRERGLFGESGSFGVRGQCVVCGVWCVRARVYEVSIELYLCDQEAFFDVYSTCA